MDFKEALNGTRTAGLDRIEQVEKKVARAVAKNPKARKAIHKAARTSGVNLLTSRIERQIVRRQRKQVAYGLLAFALVAGAIVYAIGSSVDDTY